MERTSVYGLPCGAGIGGGSSSENAGSWNNYWGKLVSNNLSKVRTVHTENKSVNRVDARPQCVAGRSSRR